MCRVAQATELGETLQSFSEFQKILNGAIQTCARGVGLFLVGDWAKILSAISLGMLLYSVINSPGKYAHENNLPMVTVFTVITILTVVATIALFVLV